MTTKSMPKYVKPRNASMAEFIPVLFRFRALTHSAFANASALRVYAYAAMTHQLINIPNKNNTAKIASHKILSPNPIRKQGTTPASNIPIKKYMIM